MISLELLRFSSGTDSTSGALFLVNGSERQFMCYTLEDEHRDKKVMHETRIPSGVYSITLRTVGGFHNRYKSRYPFHKGMLWLRDVPNFEYILIHSGNNDDHTSGCIIVGDNQKNNQVFPDGFIGSSRVAYARVYQEIIEAMGDSNQISINIIDYA
ncbi:MAG: hypothetical protein HRT61_00350 [Ekhidna sp.]|jgi:hypothetical protein|nr:hypothetical protein [Ekhidna sp.]